MVSTLYTQTNISAHTPQPPHGGDPNNPCCCLPCWWVRPRPLIPPSLADLFDGGACFPKTHVPGCAGNCHIIPLPAEENRNVSTAEALAEWVDYAVKNLRPDSVTAYSKFAGTFLRSGLDTLPLEPSKLRDWLDTHGEPGSSYRVGQWKLASAFFGYIQETRDIPHPMSKLRRPRLRKIEPRAFSFEEAQGIDQAVESDRERVVCSMYLGLGLRLSEGVALTVGDVGSDRLKVGEGKEGNVYVPLTDLIRQDLLILARGKGGDAPLLGIQDDAVSVCAKGLYRRAGISIKKGERIGVHVLRHTFMQLFQEAGGNPVAADGILRHSDGSMLAHYSHWTLSNLRGELQKFGPLTYLRQPSTPGLPVAICGGPRKSI